MNKQFKRGLLIFSGIAGVTAAILIIRHYMKPEEKESDYFK